MRSRVAIALGSLSLLAACGGGAQVDAKAPAPPAAPPSASVAAAPATPPAPLPDHALRRSAVKRTVAAGLGYFLQHVTLDDDPVLVDGRFHGFRVASLRDAGFWSGVDVRPGDVVVRVNGMPIEHPEEALEAFRALEVASELRVQMERDGAPRELRFAIVDDEPQKRADASAP
jgi:S1-C subfamily serine protease